MKGVLILLLATSSAMVVPAIARPAGGAMKDMPSVQHGATATKTGQGTGVITAVDKMIDTMLLSTQLSERTRTERPAIGRTYAARFRSNKRKPFVQAVDSVLVQRDAFLDKLHEMTAPALVLSSADDTILPMVMNRRIADRMPSAEAIEIEGAAHHVPVERPEQTNSLMLDRMNRWIEGKR